MAKRRVDFSDYNEPTWEEYTGEPPLANRWYNGVVKLGKFDEQKDQMIWIIEIQEGDFKGWGRGYYTPFEGNQKWKLQDMLKALQGGKKLAVEIDFENEKVVAAWLKKQHTTIKFKTQAYQDDITINKVSPLLVLAKGDAAPAPAPADEPLASGDDAEDVIEDYTEEELEAMSAEELAAVLTDEFDFAEEDLPAKPVKSRRDKDGSKFEADQAAYVDKLIEAILDEQDPSDENQEAVEANDAGDDPEFEDGFDDGTADDPEPEPEPAPTARRTRAAKAAPAKAAAPAPAPATRRTRRG